MLSLRRCLALALAAGAALLAAAGAPSPAAAQGFGIDHFQCYRADDSERAPRVVRLADQFGRSRADVLKRLSLCNPVDKNGEGIIDRRAHLVCYGIRSRPPFEARHVQVSNQFTDGSLLRVLAPNRLCLPSGKSHQEQKLDVPRLDHYQCYRVRPLDAWDPRSVTLKDQFDGTEARVLRPGLLCNPVSKDGGTVLNRRDHLVCYGLAAPPFDPRRVFVSNQFEAASPLTASQRESLCVPSRKRVVRPNLVPTIVGPSIPVSCPAGQGSCTTTISFRITNAGAAPAGPSDALLRADPAQATTASVAIGPLAAGASTPVLTTTLGPADNCFDPDCTISVQADANGAVAESNELDNTATLTVAG